LPQDQTPRQAGYGAMLFPQPRADDDCGNLIL
jgi:hypothetical protein